MGTRLLVHALLMAGSCQAADFGIEAAIKLGYSLPQLGPLIDHAGPALDGTSASIRFLDGSIHTLRSPDNMTTLGQLMRNDQATLIVDGVQVQLRTSAASFRQSYAQSDQAYTHIISTVVEGRPWTFEWTGALNTIAQGNTYTARINGNPVTLVLPKGMTLRDFTASLPITLLDARVNSLINQVALDTLSIDQVYATASGLGVLSLDRSLRGAQNQTMALSLGLIADQLDRAMQPALAGTDARLQGVQAWTSAQAYRVRGVVGGMPYDGDVQGGAVGLHGHLGPVLAGLAFGHQETDVSTPANLGHSQLGGNFVAPYAAIGMAENRLVLDGTLYLQELKGDASNNTLAGPLSLEGHRLGCRLSATGYMKPHRDVLLGISLGGAYMDDDLTGTYFNTRNAYGTEQGEVFLGGKAVYTAGKMVLRGSATYHHDVTAQVDDAARVFSHGRDGRIELKIAAEWRPSKRLGALLATSATLIDSNTQFKGLSGQLAYDF